MIQKLPQREETAELKDLHRPRQPAGSAHIRTEMSLKLRQRLEVRERRGDEGRIPRLACQQPELTAQIRFFCFSLFSLINLCRPNRVQELHLAGLSRAGRVSAVNRKLSVNLTDLPNHPNLSAPSLRRPPLSGNGELLCFQFLCETSKHSSFWLLTKTGRSCVTGEKRVVLTEASPRGQNQKQMAASLLAATAAAAIGSLPRLLRLWRLASLTT